MSENFEAWLEIAKKDEKFGFLYERFLALQDELKQLKKDRNILLNFINTHRHDKFGNTLFPPTFRFQD